MCFQAYYTTGYAAWSADSLYSSGISGYSVPHFRDIFEAEFLATPTYQAAAAFASLEILVAAMEMQAETDASLVTDSHAINSVIANNSWSTIFSSEELVFNPTTHLASGQWITTQIDSFLNPSVVATQEEFIYPMPKWDAIERTVNYIFPPKAVMARVLISSSVEDSAVNATFCTPDPSGLPGDTRGEFCNFRNAVEFCMQEILKSSLSNCSIVLPENSVVELNTAEFGEIEVMDAIGELSIEGSGSTLRVSNTSATQSSRLMSVFASRADLKASQSFNLRMSNATVSHFGGVSVNGGGIRVQYVNSLVLEAMSFEGRFARFVF